MDRAMGCFVVPRCVVDTKSVHLLTLRRLGRTTGCKCRGHLSDNTEPSERVGTAAGGEPLCSVESPNRMRMTKGGGGASLTQPNIYGGAGGRGSSAAAQKLRAAEV